jgi:large subunit ribosomal protein L5
MSALKQEYKKKIVPDLMKDLGLKNVMAVPKIEKITLNMGVGEASRDKKVLEHAVSDMQLISGQKVLRTKAKKSIAGFKIRDGWPIGCKVTLRGQRMYDFLNRFVNVVLPRIRDFRGLNPKSFDGNGNYSVGIKEQIVFPEISLDKIDVIRGLDIVITTSTRDDEHALSLLKKFNFPFK